MAKAEDRWQYERREYKVGEHVHYAGFAWIAQRDTNDVPGGNNDWLNVGKLYSKTSVGCHPEMKDEPEKPA